MQGSNPFKTDRNSQYCKDKRAINKLNKKIANKQKKKKKRENPLYNTDHLKGKPYSEFLKSKYWAMVRKRVLQRDGNKCRICSNTKYLQVHHDTYKHHLKEHKHLGDLLTLCRECHKEHHYAQM